MHLTFPVTPAADKEPLTFTKDQQDDIRASVKKIQQHLQMIPFFFDNEGLSREMASSVLNLSESELAALGKLMDVPTESAERIEQRHGDIRRANLRVRELEHLLGQAQPIEAIQPALRILCEQLNGWWDLEGFGHISDIAFGEYNAKVSFSCQFIGCKPHLVAPEGATHKERKALWLASLQARGFVLLEDDGAKGIKDCPESRDAMRALFAQRLGNSWIRQFVSRESRTGNSTLVSVEVVICDLALISGLPVPPADAEEIDD
ncbi:hypothetical protein [Pseudomonas guariconensis]|uniref:hypothetical protein n=1 Tax=Pseudomonas guariconensis TaxID=1288410 RepID=UPI003905C5BB